MSNPNEDKSVDASEYDRHLMGNVVRMPLVVRQALGGTIHTDHGPLQDFWGDEGVCSLGYNAPEVVSAILGFMASISPHQLPDVYPHPYRWQAAEMLCERTGMDRAFFANSGTEANEAAIKLARKFWWDQEGQPMESVSFTGEVSGEVRTGKSTTHAKLSKRHTILTIQGNFHGRTGNSMAAGDFRVSPYHRWGFGPSAKGYGVLDRTIDFNKVMFQQSITDGVEHELREPNWSEVAAIILAPVLGNNVVTTYKHAFWAELERIRRDHGVLIIFDDVQAGSGRAGHYATWQHPSCQVKPDIMTLAKGMAMGFPMSACLASQRVASAFTPGVHFNTFGGSPFMCHMAVRMLEWLDEHIDDVRAKGCLIRERFAEKGWIKEHDGWGMLTAFTPDWDRYGYDGYQFIYEARKHGLSLVTHRRHGPIRFTPPLNIPRPELEQALGKLTDTHKGLAGG